jgi:hypothetical protein
MPVIVTLTNKSNAGDNNAAIAISSALKNSLDARDENSLCNVSNPDEIAALKSRIVSEKTNHFIVVGCGAHMLEPLQILKSANVTTAFAAHQIPQNILLSSYFDSIAFPKHVIDEELREFYGDKLTETIGVAHNLTKADCVVEFEKRPELVEIAKNPKILVAILGGDAPLPSGVQQYYLPAEAIKLAEYCAAKAREGFFVVATNGPRTGKFNPENGADLNTHRVVDPKTAAKIDYKLDLVTQAFCEKMQASGFVEGSGFKLYDFKFLEKGVDSAYKGILSMAVQSSASQASAAAGNIKEVSVLVPGESTSMISECCDFLPAQAVVIVPNGAMNSDHSAHVKSVIESGQARFFDLNKMQNPADLIVSQQSVEEHKSAAETIADSILARMQSKLPSAEIASAAGEPLMPESQIQI